MEIKTPERLIKLLITAGIATSDTVSGCSIQRVAEIEETFKVKLPDSYKNFLKVMGQQAGEFYNEFGLFNVISVEQLQETREQARSYIQEYADYELKESDFVFVESGRVLYAWFDTLAGPEPPVQMLDDGDDSLDLAFNSFLEFLNVVANEQLEAEQILKDDKN